ncbi:MAG: cyclic nucleotide-binding domain-containing protein [Deltaproteobacteria bacterium]|nr:cyclic nucleotide-binding domain-containing protein [Deltaproteobacteria bacterium]
MDERYSQTEVEHSLSVRALNVQTHPYGDVVVREGEETEGFYVILSGQVRISQGGKNVRILEEQDVFGLDNLILRKPAQYTARTLSRSRIATYGRDSFEYLFHHSPQMIQTFLLSTLQQLSQTTHNLSGMTESFSIGEVRVNFYSDGEVILGEDVATRTFYRLVSSHGGLRLTKGNEELGCIEKPGEFFGGIIGFANGVHQAQVTSIGESAVEMYTIDDLEVVIKDYPDIALKIMQALIAKLSEGNPIA